LCTDHGEARPGLSDLYRARSSSEAILQEGLYVVCAQSRGFVRVSPIEVLKVEIALVIPVDRAVLRQREIQVSHDVRKVGRQYRVNLELEGIVHRLYVDLLCSDDETLESSRDGTPERIRLGRTLVRDVIALRGDLLNYERHVLPQHDPPRDDCPARFRKRDREVSA